MNDFMAYSAAFSYQNNDIMHYGVLGMKWGIRRDRQLMAERRYNKTKDDLKNKYETGKISKEDYKSNRKSAKKQMKSEIKNAKNEVRNIERKELEKRFNKVRNQAINEIPKYRLQAGLHTASSVLRGLGTGVRIVNGSINGALTASMIMGIPVASAAIGATFGAAAAGYGLSRLGKRVDDKIRRQFNR